MRIPLLIIPKKQAMKNAHYFFGVARRMLPSLRFLEKALRGLDSDLSPTEYLGLSLFNASVYFVFAGLLIFAVFQKAGVGMPYLWAAAGASVSFLGVLMLCIAYPRWVGNKKVSQIDRDLLFAARHLRVQTTAGVPLFDALVSASHGYGAVSAEFEKIVTGVEGGLNLADSLEDSAANNPSYYYSRILWQMSNAVKSGTDVGPVIAEIVDFLAEEQRIEMRNYGAQLNSIAIMYLMACIIAPTISLIFLMVISSFVELPITDIVFVFILAGMIFIQYMFIGLIESRRPSVSI
ncbi:MAG: type II secretion system F family protein [Candidatus Micrarchaeia archaeon]|jgi:pilus assembly protein TadC